MSLPRLTRSRLAAFAALAAMVILVAGCGSFGPPRPVTSEAREIEWLYYFVLVIAVVILVLVEGLILFAVVRYRRKPTDTELPPQIHGNNVLEIIWTVIPTIIVAVMFVFSFNTLNKVDAVAAERHPDHGGGGPVPVVVRVPVGRRPDGPVRAARPGDDGPGRQDRPPQPPLEGRHPRLLRPAVPVQAGRRPGRDNIFDFTVDPADAGQTFRGQCAELCGTYHGSMLFTVKALSPADYDAWLADQIAKAQADARRRRRAARPDRSSSTWRPRTSQYRQDQPRGAGRPAVHDQVPEQRPDDHPQRRDPRRGRARRSSRERSSRASMSGPTRSRPSRPALHVLLHGPPSMTGTLTVQ